MKPDKKRNKKPDARRAGKSPQGKKPYRSPSHGHQLTEMVTLLVTHLSDEGDAIAVPEEWTSRKTPPYIFIVESPNRPAASVGDRVIANLKPAGKHRFSAYVMKLLPREAPRSIVGIFSATPQGGVIAPVSRRSKESFLVGSDNTNGAHNGELVKATVIAGRYALGLPMAHIEETLGDASAPRAASLIAASFAKLPSVFSNKALAEAEAAEPSMLTPGREDLRGLPLVTIDGEDARDFDDAVYAVQDETPEHRDGFHLVVAIADVAHYVKEGSALDADAFTRGNSAYFPDRVIPMLPERLSNGLCSLKPNEDRYCLTVHLWIDAQGKTRRYRFVRGIMRSHARLTYTQVENADTLIKDDQTQKLVQNLKQAYAVLARERNKRGTLSISLPEYKVHFDDKGNLEKIAPKPTLESHRLIEAFMVAANVAAAEYLIKHQAAGIYRVHEPPTEDKLEDLRKFLGLSGYSFPKGAITPTHLNQVLHKSEDTANATMIHTAVLRSQMQAFYGDKNQGHFGLALTSYCHFTSPIRRYSDLVVHRSLAALLEHEKYKPQNLKEIALHISQTERTAMMAERDAMDRYKISYLARQKKDTFKGVISSISEHGLFVSLKETGITGFVPINQLGQDFFLYEPRLARIIGRHSNRIYKMGEAITVRVLEADALKNSLIFRPEEHRHGQEQKRGKPQLKHHNSPRNKKPKPLQ